MTDVITGIGIDLAWDDNGEVSPFYQKQILGYLDEARCLIVSLNPAYYAVTKTFKLDPGSFQNLCTCERITAYIGQIKDNCAITGNAKFPQDWGCGENRFRIFNVEINKNQLFVQPPVPEDEEVAVAVKCVPVMGDASSEEDLTECADRAALVQWALYRGTLHESDGEAAVIQQANVHLRTFADLTTLRFGAIKNYLRGLEDDM